MILLIDVYNNDSFMLHTSVLASQVKCTAISVMDNGFLPEDVRSPYMETIGQREDAAPAPLYFDKLIVPRFWEIKDAGGKSEIWDGNALKGRILYIEPTHKRYVSVVEWLDGERKVILREHYNQWGRLFAKSFPDNSGRDVIKQYFDRNGKLVLSENNVTGTISMFQDGREYIFKSRAEFVTDYICRNHWENERILYNSLSTPFFVSNILKKQGRKNGDVLFWHEEIRGEIPGNMKLILDGDTTRTDKIFALKESSIRALSRIRVEMRRFSKLGYVHPFLRENEGRREILIMTNSDQVEKISKIAESLPGFHFHIAALTTMSDRLLRLSRLSNVRLYPNIHYNEAETLFGACDFYLDINRGSEILNAIQKAFFNNMLILAFRETAHKKEYVSNRNTFGINQCEEMIKVLRQAGEDASFLEGCLKAQKKHARVETPERFQKALVMAGLVPEDTALTEKWRQEEIRLREKYREPQICFCMHDKNGKYAREVGAVMRSAIWYLSRPSCFHILHDDTLTPENREKLTAIALSGGHRIEFHDCAKVETDSSADMRQYTIGALYRLMIPDILSGLDRAIYLDADLLINDDLCKLWDLDIEDYAMAGVREYDKMEPYFNTGVLCMNLRRLRAEGNLLEKCANYISANNPLFPDQDAVNHFYASEILTLDRTWNVFTGYELEEPLVADESIYHFGGGFINMQQPSPIDLLMIRAYAQTPWGPELVREKIVKGEGRQNDLLMILGKMLWQVSSIRRRNAGKICKVYCDIRTAPNPFKKQLLQTYPPVAGDYYVDSEPSGVTDQDGIPVFGMDKLLEEKKGEVLFLIRPSAHYNEICEKLRSRGFEENKDYFNGLRVLQRRQGGYA